MNPNIPKIESTAGRAKVALQVFLRWLWGLGKVSNFVYGTEV